MSAKRSPFSQSVESAYSASGIPMPDFESPRGFDEWRRSMTELGHTREALSTAVANCGTPLASIRASQLILNQPERAKILCADGLTTANIGAYQLAKVVLAAIDIIQAYHAETNPKFVAEGVVLRLTNVLSEIKQAGGQSHVHQEALARAHVALVDAYLLLERFEVAEFHAAEAEGLGDALGIKTVVVSAKYQRACLAGYRGKSSDAHELFLQVSADPNATHVQIDRARNAIAFILLFQGDEDGLFDYLRHQDVSGSAFLRTLTFREQLVALPEEGDGNGLRAYAHAWQAVSCAFERVPWKRRADFEKALQLLHPILGKTQGFMRVAHDCLAAFIYLGLGDLLRARMHLPSLEVLEDCPPTVKLFGHALRVEIFAKCILETSNDLLRTVESAVDAMAVLPLHVIPQIAQKLQLLTPLALAIFTQCPQSPYAFRAIGKEAILRLNEKTIGVYGSQGLRPAQAVAFILQGFGVNEDVPQDGDGQRAGLTATLRRRYHERQLWYTPVAALELAWILVCCSFVAEKSDTREWLGGAINELERDYGFVPKIQRQTVDPHLENLDRVVRQTMKGIIEPTIAAKLLFGESR
jgi:hypothetical protein